MNLKQKIDELYNKSRSKNYVHNTSYLYTILQIKMYTPALSDYNSTFYKDINFCCQQLCLGNRARKIWISK